jgi:hypothetical protein
VHNFNGAGGVDGYNPNGTLIADRSGNLYGTTFLSSTGCECGTVFELAAKSGGTSPGSSCGLESALVVI